MKKLLSFMLAFVFALSLTGSAFAASANCTVTGLEDNKLILDCGKSNQDFPVGTSVKIKSKVRAIEGC